MTGRLAWSVSDHLFKDIASRLAILAPEYRPEIRAVVERESADILADSDEPSPNPGAMRWLAANPGACVATERRAQDAFNRSYRWKLIAEALFCRLEQES